MNEILVERGRYFDSVFLMRISRELEAIPGVRRAVVAMGTPANLAALESVGFKLTAEAVGPRAGPSPGDASAGTSPLAGPQAGLRADDLVTALDAESPDAFEAAKRRLVELLAAGTEESEKTGEEIIEMNVTKPSRATFPPQYLEDIVKACPENAALLISLKSNAPLKVEYEVESAKVVYYLAPRID